jgi:regulation of enolase protein 1 (concanavalin A-like superfamily)
MFKQKSRSTSQSFGEGTTDGSPTTNSDHFSIKHDSKDTTQNKQPLKMLRSLKVPIFIVLFAATGSIIYSSFASTTRNHFLYTNTEITEYQRRMSGTGPFYKRGDAGYGGQYSPGDGQNSERLAAAFLADPQASYWKQPNLPYSSGDQWPCEKTTKEPCMRFMHAAWVYMTKPSHPQRAQLRNEVKKLMVYVSNEPTLNYANETNYNTNYPGFTPSPIFGHAIWMTRIMKARDMIGRDALSAAENARFDRWLYDYSNWTSLTFHANRVKHLPGRLNRDYSVISSAFNTPSNEFRKGYDGSPGIGLGAMAYHNRNVETVAAADLAANYLKYYGFQAPTSGGASYGRWTIDRLLDHGRIVVEETIRFSVYPQGMQGDFERGDGTRHNASAQTGWLYSANTLQPMVEIAKHHAKRGDMSVWNFKTTAGHEGTAGSPNNTSGVSGFPEKNLHFYTWTMSRYSNNGWNRKNRNEPLALPHQIHDMIPAAIAHQYNPNDALLEAAWKRQGLNFPAYPQNPQSQGSWPGYQGHGAKYIGLIEVGGMGPFINDVSTSPPVQPVPTTPTPTISVVSPTEGSTVTGTVTINVDTNNNSSINKVEFYHGTTLISADSSAPFSAEWDTTKVANASYNITAKALDSTGKALAASSVVKVTVNNQAPRVQEPLPAPWQNRDIGSVVRPGFVTAENNQITIEAQSNDIWDDKDSFHYVYQPYQGDVTITARVTSLTQTSIWTKAGVMIRENLEPNSRHAMAIVTPARGTAVQYRTETGGQSLNQNFLTDQATPYWVRLTRQGNTITGYSSPNGTDWREIAQVSIELPESVFIGLPLTSNNPNQLATANFDNISVVRPPVVIEDRPSDEVVGPTVSITSPDPGSTISGSVLVAAEATEGSAEITKVEFYRNDRLITTDTQSPYSYNWNTALDNNGEYTLTAVAYDTNNNRQTSEAITTSVNNTPVSEPITKPKAVTGLTGVAVSPSQINLQWSHENASSIAGYDVYRNNTKIATVTGTSLGDTGLPADSTLTYYVVARDSSGNTSEPSNTISVSTLQAPEEPEDPVVPEEPEVPGTEPITSSGIVRGEVSSDRNQTLGGTKVTLLANGSRRTFVTPGSGEYVFRDLSPGDYSVEYRRAPHYDQKKTVNVKAGQTTTEDVVLVRWR